MSKQYDCDKEFKENPVKYYKELNLKKCSDNLGISASTLSDLIKKIMIIMVKYQLENQAIIQVMRGKC